MSALTVDRERHIARLDGQPLDLSRQEFKLLAKLSEDPERLYTREELTRHLWDWPSGAAIPVSRVVDTVASRLRKKLGRDYIVNVWGMGYRLVKPSVYEEAA